MNEDILKNPYNDELAQIGMQFGELLRRIIETVDRYESRGVAPPKAQKRGRSFQTKLENVTADQRSRWRSKKDLRRMDPSCSHFLTTMMCLGTITMQSMRSVRSHVFEMSWPRVPQMVPGSMLLC